MKRRSRFPLDAINRSAICNMTERKTCYEKTCYEKTCYENTCYEKTCYEKTCYEKTCYKKKATSIRKRETL